MYLGLQAQLYEPWVLLQEAFLSQVFICLSVYLFIINVWWGSSAPRHNPELDFMMKNVLANQDIMNIYPKYCKSNLKGWGTKQDNPEFFNEGWILG